LNHLHVCITVFCSGELFVEEEANI